MVSKRVYKKEKQQYECKNLELLHRFEKQGAGNGYGFIYRGYK